MLCNIMLLLPLLIGKDSGFLHDYKISLDTPTLNERIVLSACLNVHCVHNMGFTEWSSVLTVLKPLDDSALLSKNLSSVILA